MKVALKLLLYQKENNYEKGFMLIELMIIIIIVALLAAALVPTIMSKRESLSEEKTLNKDKNGYDTPVYSFM